MPLSRHMLSAMDLEKALDAVRTKTWYRMRQKGRGATASSHEILGCIVDEVEEYRDEVHAKSDGEAKVQELLDIAVAAVWGIASIRAGGTDR